MTISEREKDRLIEAVQLVYINGVPLDDPKPAPPYAFAKMEIDYDSGRNINGIMERNVLEHHAHTLDLTFSCLNGTQMARLLNLLDNSTLSVTAFDPFTNAMQTYTMYHGDLKPEITWYDWDNKINAPTPIYESFKVSLVEY